MAIRAILASIPLIIYDTTCSSSVKVGEVIDATACSCTERDGGGIKYISNLFSFSSLGSDKETGEALQKLTASWWGGP